MARNFNNWLQSFVNYASIGEAPLSIYFWVGVSTVAGALRRKVWIDQTFFRWTPNFFILIVAPPGIISKSTSASIGMDLLKEVPGIHFGPDSITWQSLITELAAGVEVVRMPDGADLPMSNMTIESSELGVFLDPENKQLVSALIQLWDGRMKFGKSTKGSGLEEVPNPWVNLLGCTTPSWLRDNIPDSMVGGGFWSRMVTLFAEEKRQRVAYLHRQIPANHLEVRAKLIEDLTHISNFCGAFTLSAEAEAVGTHWYNDVLPNVNGELKGERYNAFLARKQTMVHKLAMVLSAAQRDTYIITESDMLQAIELVNALEADLPKIYGAIGQTDISRFSSELVAFVREHGEVDYTTLFRHMFRVVGTPQDFEDLIQGAARSGYVQVHHRNGMIYVSAKAESNGSTH